LSRSAYAERSPSAPSGLHQTAVARIESGDRQPTLPTIFKIAEGLEVPPAELFAGID
jgi:transcriptional regulator with XRE-family HTH domain